MSQEPIPGVAGSSDPALVRASTTFRALHRSSTHRWDSLASVSTSNRRVGACRSMPLLTFEVLRIRTKVRSTLTDRDQPGVSNFNTLFSVL